MTDPITPAQLRKAVKDYDENIFALALKAADRIEADIARIAELRLARRAQAVRYMGLSANFPLPWCVTCTAYGAVDPDGCCTTCGCDAILPDAKAQAELLALIRRARGHLPKGYPLLEQDLDSALAMWPQQKDPQP